MFSLLFRILRYYSSNVPFDVPEPDLSAPILVPCGVHILPDSSL